jgi:methylthioribose-1-phosphate isomerase
VAAGVAAAAVGAVAAKAAVKPGIKPAPAGKPATTIVKTGGAKAVSPARPGAATAMPVAATQFREEGSTTLTTCLAVALAVLTWGTAGVLLASYLAYI